MGEGISFHYCMSIYRIVKIWNVVVIYMIPKVIHYCWFGGSPLPDDVKRYIDSWRKYCPDYEIIEWNEGNFDIDCCAYVKEAYEAKKWAFVTDYVRLYVLYNHGGIYMDTDVEVVKPLDELLRYSALSGYESNTSIPTGTMGACRGNKWIKMLLDDYSDRHFFMSDGSYDKTTNVTVITNLTTQNYGLVLDGKTKIFGDNIIMLPFDYLCAKSYRTGIIMQTENTYTIHHFKGSWMDNEKITTVKKIKDISISYMLFVEKYVYYFLVLRITYEAKGISGVIKLLFTKLRNSWKLKNI